MYEQINTFSLTSKTTALVVFKHQLGMEAWDTTNKTKTNSFYSPWSRTTWM